jgi:hypothetical protein
LHNSAANQVGHLLWVLTISSHSASISGVSKIPRMKNVSNKLANHAAGFAKKGAMATAARESWNTKLDNLANDFNKVFKDGSKDTKAIDKDIAEVVMPKPSNQMQLRKL